MRQWFLSVALIVASLPSLADDAPPPLTPSPPSPPSSEKFVFVPSGVERSVNFVSVLFPDCSAIGSVIARLQNKPEHGTVEFKDDNSFSVFPVGSARDKCNLVKVPGLITNYKSEDNYVGDDHFDVMYLYPTSTAAIVRYTVSVR